MAKSKKYLFPILKLAVFAVFLGRGWQHLYWDAPYRALLWDESLMRPLLEGVAGISWKAFVADQGTDIAIQQFVKIVGVFYCLSALAVLFIEHLRKVGRFLLILGGGGLVLLALLYAKERFYSAAQFFEYSLQFGSPFFLAWYLSENKWSRSMVFAMKLATAFTFISHGLYAIGFYPRPAVFSSMTMLILNCSEAQAAQFLVGAAIGDFVASILLFLPRPFNKIGLVYCVCWGAATATARLWAHFRLDWWEESLLQWLHESLFRFPHFMIPLLILLLIVSKKTPGSSVVQ